MTLRDRLRSIIETTHFSWFIAFLLVVNAVILGLETDDGLMAQYGVLLETADRVILGIFVIEILTKLYVQHWSFFRHGWNVFDFIIVGIALIPAIGPFAMLRTLRIFRVLRLVSVVPKMRRVVAALLSAIPGMASILAVLLVIFYIASVLTTQLFGHADDPALQELFGSVGDSMFTLFQLMTLEGWVQDIAEPTMALFPHSWLFFVLFIIITTFAVLNLFIGIIVDAMNTLHEEEGSAERGLIHDDKMAALNHIRDELKHLREEIAALKNPPASKE